MRSSRNRNQPHGIRHLANTEGVDAGAKASGLTTNQRTDLSKHTLDDTLGVDITRRGEKMIKIVNIYNQRARETGEGPAKRLNWEKIIKQGGGGTVHIRDYNAHS